MGALAARTQPKIAIVGAGLAGVVCAHKLRQQGFAAEVFEAGARAGGQVDPASDADFVAKHHYYTRALCAELGVALRPLPHPLGDVPPALRDAIKNADDVPDTRNVSSLKSALADDLCPVITGLDADACALSYFLARTTLSDARTVQDLLGYHFRFRAFTLIEKMAVPVTYNTRIQALDDLKHDVVVLATVFDRNLTRGTLSKTKGDSGIKRGEVGVGGVIVRGGKKAKQLASVAWRPGEAYEAPNVEGRIVRAGEHMAETAYGTYEGAIESGERAAADAIKICNRAK